MILAVGIGTSFMGYRQLAYWITNKRTIGRRGVVGYSADSMPIENIADVVISRSVFDRVTGLSTLYIQPFGGAGMMMAPGNARMNPYTGSNSFTGINHDEAADIQQLIFHLRDAIKRETSR